MIFKLIILNRPPIGSNVRSGHMFGQGRQNVRISLKSRLRVEQGHFLNFNFVDTVVLGG